MDKKKIHYWTKPIEEVVQKSIAVYLTQHQELEVGKRITPKTIDIVYGGDHGQGKFRAVVKIIFRDVHQTNVASIVLKVGHIDCKKDMYCILRDTITPKINKSLEKLKTSGAIVTTQTSINGKNIMAAKLKQTNYVNDTNDVVLNLRVFITDDLAFYAAVLGKVNMSGTWCT